MLNGRARNWAPQVRILYPLLCFGRLAEWSMAYDWKSYVPLKGTRSSNLLPSSAFRDSLIGRTPDSESGDEGSSPSLGTKIYSRVYDAGIRSLTLIQRLAGSIPALGTVILEIIITVFYILLAPRHIVLAVWNKHFMCYDVFGYIIYEVLHFGPIVQRLRIPPFQGGDKSSSLFGVANLTVHTILESGLYFLYQRGMYISHKVPKGTYQRKRLDKMEILKNKTTLGVIAAVLIGLGGVGVALQRCDADVAPAADAPAETSDADAGAPEGAPALGTAETTSGTEIAPTETDVPSILAPTAQ